MSYITVKTEGDEPVTINFFAWQGVPKYARPVIEAVTRLGGSTLLLQKTKTEAVVTESKAFSSITKTTTFNIKQLTDLMNKLVGKKAIWTDTFTGLELKNFYILSYTYTAKVVDPSEVMLVEWSISCTTDDGAADAVK